MNANESADARQPVQPVEPQASVRCEVETRPTKQRRLVRLGGTERIEANNTGRYFDGPAEYNFDGW
jgi:hypothetical protein